MKKIEVGHLLFQRKIRQEKKFALRAKKIFRASREKKGILARFWTARGGGGSPIRPYIRPGKIRPYLKNFEIRGGSKPIFAIKGGWSVRPNTPFVHVFTGTHCMAVSPQPLQCLPI